MRIELTPSAWKAEVLPLNYTRIIDLLFKQVNGCLERKTRFELATLALARRCSTPEPLPHKKTGNVLLSQAASHQVSSALESLTAVFEMGTGVSSPL